MLYCNLLYRWYSALPYTAQRIIVPRSAIQGRAIPCCTALGRAVYRTLQYRAISYRARGNKAYAVSPPPLPDPPRGVLSTVEIILIFLLSVSDITSRAVLCCALHR